MTGLDTIVILRAVAGSTVDARPRGAGSDDGPRHGRPPARSRRSHGGHEAFWQRWILRLRAGWRLGWRLADLPTRDLATRDPRLGDLAHLAIWWPGDLAAWRPGAL